MVRLVRLVQEEARGRLDEAAAPRAARRPVFHPPPPSTALSGGQVTAKVISHSCVTKKRFILLAVALLIAQNHVLFLPFKHYHTILF